MAYAKPTKKARQQMATNTQVAKINLARIGSEFENVNKPLERVEPGCCSHEGPCSDKRCSCVKDRTTCKRGCACGDSCGRQFPPCECQPLCGSHCNCHKNDRWCSSNCACSSCQNSLAHAKCPKLLLARSSTIPGAGSGLFAGVNIPIGTLIGQFRGTLTKEGERRKRDGVTDIWISKGFGILFN